MSDDVTGSPLQVEDRSEAATGEAVVWERPRPRLGVAVLAAVATFLVIGVPTDIVPNPLFGREVPVRPWEPYVLVLTSVLTGLWFGLQRARATSPEQEEFDRILARDGLKAALAWRTAAYEQLEDPGA